MLTFYGRNTKLVIVGNSATHPERISTMISYNFMIIHSVSFSLGYRKRSLSLDLDCICIFNKSLNKL